MSGSMARAADPLRTAVVVLIWALLALFVVYPLVMLGLRAVSDHGVIDLAPALTALRQANTVRAFLDSLLLATLVGVLGTVLGFLFAFTVVRARLGRVAV